MKLTAEQYNKLVEGIAPNRIGKNPKGYSHVEAWDDRRWLIRIFGFGGFDIETKALDLVAQIEHQPGAITYANGGKNNRTVWTVVYRAEVRLTVKTPGGQPIAVYEDASSGDAQNQPSLGDAHDNAMKTALSQALKRCCVNWGDQFGLSLYNNGQTNPVVLRSLVAPEAPASAPAGAVLPVEDAPVQPEPDARQPDHTEPAVGGESWDDAQPTRRPAPQPAPPPSDPLEERKVQPEQHKLMHVLWRQLGFDGDANRDKRLEITAKILKLPGLDSSAELTAVQADTVITALQKKLQELRKAKAA